MRPALTSSLSWSCRTSSPPGMPTIAIGVGMISSSARFTTVTLASVTSPSATSVGARRHA